MPLALLDPRLDLASLAEMGDVASDWMIENDVAPADVALIFAQGFKVSRRGEAPQHWHLPRSCLARYAGNAFGEERQAAVESWRVVEHHGNWLIEQVGRILFAPGGGDRRSVHRSKAAAGREWRRCILREFPEIHRFITCHRCGGGSIVTPQTHCPECLNTGLLRRRAWEFVVPEPETEREELTVGGATSPLAIPASQLERFAIVQPHPILVGDRVTLDGDDRVRRAEEGDPVIGVAVAASDAYDGTVLIRTVPPAPTYQPAATGAEEAERILRGRRLFDAAPILPRDPRHFIIPPSV